MMGPRLLGAHQFLPIEVLLFCVLFGSFLGGALLFLWARERVEAWRRWRRIRRELDREPLDSLFG